MFTGKGELGFGVFHEDVDCWLEEITQFKLGALERREKFSSPQSEFAWFALFDLGENVKGTVSEFSQNKIVYAAITSV